MCATCLVLVFVMSAFAPLSGAGSAEGTRYGGAVPAADADYMRFININGFEFDPLEGVPDLPEGLEYDSSKTVGLAYYIVQFNGPITRTMKEDLSETGATVLHYVSYNAFVVRADKATVERAEDLSAVRWVGLFEPAYKLSPRLAEDYDSLVDSFMLRSSQDVGLPTQTSARDRFEGLFPEMAGTRVLSQLPEVTRKSVSVEISVFEEWNLPVVLDALARMGGKGMTYSYQSSGMIRAELDRGSLAALAREVGVMWIDRDVPQVFYNDIARWVVQSGDSVNYATPIHEHGILGTNQTVTVCDTGIDYEHDAFEDPSVSVPGPTHRKVTDYYVPEGGGGDSSDNGGNHGTHTSATVAGDDGVWHVYDGDYAGSNGTTGPHDGIAFDADVNVQDLSPDGYGIYLPANFSMIYLEALERDSWIHSNSWGSWGAEYSGEAAITDEFIWDNQDFLVLYSAGNDGAYSGALNPEAAAKNVIAVGATLNGQLMNDVADFSSRGPVTDGRLKPDVMAPGVGTWSAEGGDPYGETDAYIQHSGTSMAAPTVAGSCALIRQYYMDGWYPTGSPDLGDAFTPSAALIKATVINSGAEMTGAGAYSMDEIWYPNNNQGWGRVTLDDALYFEGDTRGLFAYDERYGLSTGDTTVYRVAIGDDSQPFEATLVWSDYPGTPYSYPSLVNDLDMIVTAPDGTVYIGNQYAGFNPGESVKNPVDYDRLNNVEGVLVISDMQVGVWTIEVVAHNTPVGPQPYAFVVTGQIATELGVVSLDRARYQSDDVIRIHASDTDLDLDPEAVDTAWVLLSSTTEDIPENITLTETGISTSSFEATVQLELRGSALPHDGVLQVQNMDTINVSYYDEDNGLGGTCWTADYATVDDDPPIITNVSVTSLRAKSCKIVWDTDETSNSTVWFGTTIHPTESVSSTAMVVDHSISLNRLTENQTYYFAVGSSDYARNAAYDDNGSEYYTFTTPVLPPMEEPNEDWPTFNNNAARLGMSPSAGIPPLELMWQVDTNEEVFLTSPVVSDGVLVTHDSRGWLRAYNPYSGDEMWSAQMGSDSVGRIPVIADGVVYWTGWTQENQSVVVATDLNTGAQLWALELLDLALFMSQEVTLTYHDGMLFAGDYYSVFALDAEDGDLVWVQDSAGMYQGVSVANGFVYTNGRADQTVRALDEYSGEIVWASPSGSYPTGAPCVTGDTVYVLTEGAGLYAYDAFNGDLLWNAGGLGYAFEGSPVCDGTAVYVGSIYDNTLYAIDPIDGTTLWTSYEYYALNYMAVANGYLYSVAPYDGLVVRNVADGTVVYSYPISMIVSAPAVCDGWVYLFDYTGTVYGLRGLVPAGLQVVPTMQMVDALPDSEVRFDVTVGNIGYLGPDTFDIEVTLEADSWVTGLFAADGVTPLEDTDGDLVIDTGPLDTYENTTIVVMATAPSDAIGGDSDTTVLRFVSSTDTNRSKDTTMTATVPPPATSIGPSAYESVSAGDSMVAEMDVVNEGGLPDTIDIEASSESGWSVSLFEADGSTPLADTDGDLIPDVGSVGGLESVTIVVSLEVPADAAAGTFDRTIITARSSLDTEACSDANLIAELAGSSSSEWPTYRHDNARSGISPIDYELPLTWEWSHEDYYSDFYMSSPVISDHTVYVADDDGVLSALDVTTGTEVWTRDLGMYGYPGTPSVENGLVYVTGSPNYYSAGIYAIDQDTGSQVWSYATPSDYAWESYCTPVVALGNVYWMESYTGIVRANDACTGELMWTRQSDEGYGFFGPSYWAGMIFVGDIYSGVVAIDALTGEEIWTREDIAAFYSPLVSEAVLYVMDSSRQLVALNPFDGTTVWSSETRGYAEICCPLAADGMVFVGVTSYYDGYAYMQAFDATDGELVWEQVASSWYAMYASPAYSNGVLYTTSSDGYLRAWEGATGEMLLEEYVDSEYSSPALGDGYLISLSYGGCVDAFSFEGAGVPVAAEVTPDPLALAVGEAGTVEVVVTDVYGNPVQGIEFEWESLEALGAVYPLTEDGGTAAYIAGNVAGTDTLEFTSDLFSGTTTVEIGPGTGARVVIDPASVTLAPGETTQFSASVTDEFGNERDDTGIVWSASESAGLIDSDGTLVATTVAGTGTVTAVFGDYSTSALVIIEPGDVSAVSANPESATVVVGSFLTIEAAASDVHGNLVPGIQMEWSCTSGTTVPIGDYDDTAVFVAPTQPGTAEVLVSAGGYEATVSLTVVAGAFDHIALSPERITLQTGEAADIQASWKDAYGNDLEEDEMDWECDIGELTVSSDTTSAEFRAGSFTGEGLVTVSSGDIAASASVTVVDGALVSLGEALVIGPLLLAVAVVAVVLYMVMKRRKGPPAAEGAPPPEQPPAA